MATTELAPGGASSNGTAAILQQDLATGERSSGSSDQDPASLIQEMRSAVLDNEHGVIQSARLKPVLMEMMRRGDSVFANEIEAVLVECDRRARKHQDRADELATQLPPSRPGTPEDKATQEKRLAHGEQWTRAREYRRVLELLTAYRHLRNEPAPVRVDFYNLGVALRARPPVPSAAWPDLPTVNVFVQNIDPLERTFLLMRNLRPYHPGDEGCLTIRNAATGDPAESLGPRKVRIGDSLELGFADFETFEIDLADHFHSLPPGQFELAIRDFNLDASCKLEILKRIIWIETTQRLAIRKRLAKLDRSGVPVVLDRPYGLWIADRIPPRSNLGKLLFAGWAAVPDLLKELEDPQKTTQDRAHTLALLFSITGQVDPRGVKGRWPELTLPRDDNPMGPSALGPYFEYQAGADTDTDTPPGDGLNEREWPMSIKLRFGGVQHLRKQAGERPDDPELAPNAAVQQELIKKWQTLRDYIEVRDPTKVKPTGGGTGFF